MTDTYRVRIIDRDTGEVVKEFVAATQRAAERIERGVSINLDHDHFRTEVVEAGGNHAE